eukprot:4249226-Prymnesium_polylepis.1
MSTPRKFSAIGQGTAKCTLRPNAQPPVWSWRAVPVRGSGAGCPPRLPQCAETYMRDFSRVHAGIVAKNLAPILLGC